jgi:hypothetical protein
MSVKLPPDVWRRIFEESLVCSVESGGGAKGVVDLLPVCKEWNVRAIEMLHTHTLLNNRAGNPDATCISTYRFYLYRVP